MFNFCKTNKSNSQMLTPDNGDALVMQSGAMLTSARTGEQKYVNAGVEHTDRLYAVEIFVPKLDSSPWSM